MKLVSRLAVATLASLVVAGAAMAADFTFKYGNSQPEQAARSQSMIWFKDELEKRTNGAIEVQNFFNAVLGNEQEMYDQVVTGVLQGTRGGFFGNANPKFSIFLLPFLVEGWDEMECLVRSDFARGIEAGSAANGIHVPATGISQGFRMYTNNVRPITSVSDLQGLKIREPQQDLMIKVANALGSNATAMAFSDVYAAFQRGVIDGQHNPPANIWNYKIYEVQKYLSVTNHMTGPDPLLVSKPWYDSLPADLQATFDEVAVEALILSDTLAREAESVLLEKLGEHMEVNTLTPEGIATFQEAVVPVYDDAIADGLFTQEDLDAARAAAKSC